MADFIVSVVVYVLRHVLVEHLQGLGVSVVPASAGHLTILNSAQLIVLAPKVGLDDLSGCKPSQDRNVAWRDLAARFGSFRQHSNTHRSSSERE